MLKNVFSRWNFNYFPETVQKQVGFLKVNFAIDVVV